MGLVALPSPTPSHQRAALCVHSGLPAPCAAFLPDDGHVQELPRLQRTLAVASRSRASGAKPGRRPKWAPSALIAAVWAVCTRARGVSTHKGVFVKCTARGTLRPDQSHPGPGLGYRRRGRDESRFKFPSSAPTSGPASSPAGLRDREGGKAVAGSGRLSRSCGPGSERSTCLRTLWLPRPRPGRRERADAGFRAECAATTRGSGADARLPHPGLQK